MIAEFHQRLAALEESQRDLHAKVDAAVQSGALEPDLQEHAAHVLRKHFFHDRPEKEPEPPPRPKFDAFTGAPLQ